MNIMDFVKPELIVVSVVLYFIGISIKKDKSFNDCYIPYVLGGIGILLCGVWVMSNCCINTFQDVFAAIFTSVVQGVLTAGLSTYVNQLIKQINKK